MKAVSGVNIAAMPLNTASSFSGSAPARIPRVPTACSFAMKAEMTATVFFQSPRPRGEKIQAKVLPMPASMDCSTSSTISRLVLKACRNQMMTQTEKMIVPALMMKPRARSHIWIRTPLKEGIW